jgi:hypothetical protein
MTQPNLLLVRKRLSWLQAMREPQRALGWSLCEWERVVRLARPLRLLARLAEALDREQLLPRVAPQPRGLLIAAQRLSADRLTALRWAADRVLPLLEPCTGARVLLKGAAYVAQGLPIAHGRLPSDLDLMVPQAEIGAAQQALRLAGWQEAPLDEHDRRYYHEWSHEVPPMNHALHRMELDLHHNILPPVARTRVSAPALLATRLPVDRNGWTGWQVLAPVDQVLHCASHLFLDSEARARVRDLVDLDGLLRHFAARPTFWPDLLSRADELGLQEPLALAVHFCAGWLQHARARRVPWPTWTASAPVGLKRVAFDGFGTPVLTADGTRRARPGVARPVSQPAAGPVPPEPHAAAAVATPRDGTSSASALGRTTLAGTPTDAN